MGCCFGRALFCAIRESQMDVINLILGLRWETKAIDQRWSGALSVSPLEWSVIISNRPVADMLIRRGANMIRSLSPVVALRYGGVQRSKL